MLSGVLDASVTVPVPVPDDTLPSVDPPAPLYAVPPPTRKRRHRGPRPKPKLYEGVVSARLAGLVRARWQYDQARYPEDYPQGPLGIVTMEDDVLTLHDRPAGNVLNRYRLLGNIAGVTTHEDGAYRYLEEL